MPSMRVRYLQQMYRLVVNLVLRPWLSIAFVILTACACTGGASSPGELLGKQSSTTAATRSTREDMDEELSEEWASWLGSEGTIAPTDSEEAEEVRRTPGTCSSAVIP
jgi:hypothetical protein